MQIAHPFTAFILVLTVVSTVLAFTASSSLTKSRQPAAFSFIAASLVIDTNLWLLGWVADVTNQASTTVIAGLAFNAIAITVAAFAGRLNSR